MTVLRACCPPAPAPCPGAGRETPHTHPHEPPRQPDGCCGRRPDAAPPWHERSRPELRNPLHSWPLHWGRTAWLRGPLAEATRAALPAVTAPRWHPAPAEARRGGLGQRRGGAGWASGGEGQGGPAAGTTELLDDSVPVLEGRRCPETRDPTGGPQASATAREAGPKRTSAQGPTPHG